MAEVVNVGKMIAVSIKAKLITYRLLVVKEGNANLLNELDKLIDFANEQNLPFKEQKNIKLKTFMGLVTIVVTIVPWCMGVYSIYSLVKLMFV
jgi:hypothetical protein